MELAGGADRVKLPTAQSLKGFRLEGEETKRDRGGRWGAGVFKVVRDESRRVQSSWGLMRVHSSWRALRGCKGCEWRLGSWRE